MKDTYQHFSTKLDMSKGSAWSTINGPTATVIATAKRLQWRFQSPSVIEDDVGTHWDFQQDTTAAIAEAVSRSVDRWRKENVARELLAAEPHGCDVDGFLAKAGSDHVLHSSWAKPATVVANIAAHLKPLYQGKKKACQSILGWASAHRS